MVETAGSVRERLRRVSRNGLQYALGESQIGSCKEVSDNQERTKIYAEKRPSIGNRENENLSARPGKLVACVSDHSREIL